MSQQYNQNAQIYESQFIIRDSTTITSSTFGSLIVDGGVSSKDTFVTGHININEVDITPNPNDFVLQRQFNWTSASLLNIYSDIPELYFVNDVVSSFNIKINAESSSNGNQLTSTWDIIGTRKDNNWTYTSSFTGDVMSLDFNVTNSIKTINNQSKNVAQITYTTGYSSGSLMYRGTTTAPYGVTPDTAVNTLRYTSGSFIPNALVYNTTDNRVGYASGVTYDGATGTLTTKNILPAAHESYDLGSETLKWRDLWLSGNTIHLGDTQIKYTEGSVSLGDANTSIALTTIVATGTSHTLGNVFINGNTVSAATLQATSITGGSISVSGNLNGNTVSSATLQATSITGGSISVSGNVNGNTVSAATLQATSITGGSISVNGNVNGNTVSAATLQATSITGGSISVSGNVSANNIRLTGDVLFSGSARSVGAATAHGLNLITNNTSRLSIISSGNVGIGTTSPKALLQIGTTDGDKIIFSEFQGTAGSKITHSTNWSVDHYAGRGLENAGRFRFFTSQTSGHVERMVLNSSGSLGIGTTTPVAPLHVSGTIPVYYPTGVFYIDGNFAYDLTGEYTGNVSIYASGQITADTFAGRSDNRIKRNMQDISDYSALETLRLLEPKTYKYIDILKQGNETIFGFSAQQVRSVFPQAVNIQKDYIPNIYSMVTVGNYGSHLILPNTLNTSMLTNQRTGGSMSIPIKCYIDGNDTQIITNVVNIIDSHTIEIDTPITEKEVVFVYGQEVNDFHTLDKNAIWTVATAAVQQIDRELQQTKERLATLETFLQTKFPGEI